MSNFFGWLRTHASSIYFMFLGLALIAVVGGAWRQEARERAQVISEHPQCLLLDRSNRDNYYYMVCDGAVVIVKSNS
jgi:hypothetical protein